MRGIRKETRWHLATVLYVLSQQSWFWVDESCSFMLLLLNFSLYSMMLPTNFPLFSVQHSWSTTTECIISHMTTRDSQKKSKSHNSMTGNNQSVQSKVLSYISSLQSITIVHFFNPWNIQSLDKIAALASQDFLWSLLLASTFHLGITSRYLPDEFEHIW